MIDAKVQVDASAARRMLAVVENPPKEDMAAAVADANVLPAIQNYPPQSGKKMQWASDKQRRYVIGAIRRGEIQVPYRRSGDYGGSFQKIPIPDGVSLASQLPSAPYVRGMDPPQAAYHRGNWEPLNQIATNVENDASVTATGVLLQALDQA